MTRKVLGNPKDLLEKRRQVIERIREKMPSEAAALEALDIALQYADASDSTPAPGPYTDVRRGIDALVMHLAKHGSPMDRRQLVTEVISGGWSNGDPLAYMKLWDVIRHQWSGAAKQLLVKRKDGKVALAKGATSKAGEV